MAEQNEPKPWVGNTSAASGSTVGEPVRRGVLGADQRVGVVGAEQVGAADAPYSSEPPVNTADLLAVRRRERVRQVV